MKYLKKYKLFEKKEEKKFTGENRIILLGPPTVGKSTISKALGEKLDLEVISLDMNQMKFGVIGVFLFDIKIELQKLLLFVVELKI